MDFDALGFEAIGADPAPYGMAGFSPALAYSALSSGAGLNWDALGSEPVVSWYLIEE